MHQRTITNLFKLHTDLPCDLILLITSYQGEFWDVVIESFVQSLERLSLLPDKSIFIYDCLPFPMCSIVQYKLLNGDISRSKVIIYTRQRVRIKMICRWRQREAKIQFFIMNLHNAPHRKFHLSIRTTHVFDFVKHLVAESWQVIDSMMVEKMVYVVLREGYKCKSSEDLYFRPRLLNLFFGKNLWRNSHSPKKKNSQEILAFFKLPKLQKRHPRKKSNQI